jgi:hypothetical protein
MSAISNQKIPYSPIKKLTHYSDNTIPNLSVHRVIKNTSFNKMQSTNDKRVHQFLIFSLTAKTML